MCNLYKIQMRYLGRKWEDTGEVNLSLEDVKEKLRLLSHYSRRACLLNDYRYKLQSDVIELYKIVYKYPNGDWCEMLHPGEYNNLTDRLANLMLERLRDEAKRENSTIEYKRVVS